MNHHDHVSMVAGFNSARDFLHRFFIVTGLLIPLVILSLLGKWPFWQLAIASVIFFFGLIFFQHAGHEIRARQYGMMTLVSVAVGSGYLFSVVATLIPTLGMEFYLEIS